MFAVTLLILCAILAVAFGDGNTSGPTPAPVIKHHLVTYVLADSAAGNYAGGSQEHHCFEEVDGIKKFVRGSYGMFGYFEGFADPMNSDLFHVNFWEGSNRDGDAVSGAASIMYGEILSGANVEDSGPFVKGIFWNTGKNNIMGSNDEWHAKQGVSKCEFIEGAINQSCTGGADFLKQCLYDPASPNRHALYNENGFKKGNAYSAPTVQPKPATAPIGSPDVVSQISLKQLYESSSWLGAYTLHSTIPAGQNGGEAVHVEERGHYGQAQAFNTSNGAGVYGSWNAVSPEPASGSMLYKFTDHGGKPKLVGWWCESEERDIEGSGTPPLTEIVRSECYHEEDHLVKKKNDLCPKIFGEDENDPLRRLANVANRGVSRD